MDTTILLISLLTFVSGNTEESLASQYVPRYIGNSSAAHEGFIGFTAWAQQTIEYDEYGEVIVFTGQLVNEGNHYSPVTGRFTCPFDGTYFVSVGITSDDSDGRELSVAVFHDLDYHIYCDTRARNAFDTCAHSMIISCQSGQPIFMISVRSGLVYGDSTVPRSTFTVMLLSQTVHDVRHEDVIGFSVAKSVAQFYDTGDFITYGELLYNGGNAYNFELNRFVCPVSGVYFMAFSSWKYESYPLHLSLMKIDEPILATVDLESYFTYATNNGIFYCEANDTIHVIASGSGWVIGHPTFPFTTHSGFLVAPLQDNLEKKHDSYIGITLYKTDIQNYNTSDIITFEGIVYDSGHYLHQTSEFECPVGGIYYVTLNAKKDGRSELDVYVDHEDEAVFVLQDRTRRSNGNIFSNSALVIALAGDVIQVKAGGSGSIYGQNSTAQTTWTVMLMYEN